jgi:hypothetical protein
MFWSKRKRPAVKLSLECLESRIVPDAYLWNPHPGGDFSSWDDGNNWQNVTTGFWGNVPGAGDSASVNKAGYTIYIKPTDNVSIGQLNWSTMGSSLVILGNSAGAGSLTFGPNQSTIAGDVTDYGNLNAAANADVIFSGGIYVGGAGYTGGNLTGVSVHGSRETSVYYPHFVYEGAATAVSVSTGSKPRRAGGQELRHSVL